MTLEEAERQLTMNLTLIAMLKGNTPDEVMAKFGEEWVEPWEDVLVKLKSRNA